MQVRQTSIEAYSRIKKELGKRQQEVYDGFLGNGTCTNLELSRLLGIPINQITEGAACTTLFAREYINNTNPLVIANSDQIVDVNFQDFIDDCLNRNLDGSIMTFRDLEKNPKWSFAKTNSKGQVIQV